MGPIESRFNQIIKPLKNFLIKPLEFNNVIEIYGYSLTGNSKFDNLGIITVEGTKATVDFKKILEIDSNLVILTVRTKINPEIPKHLISTHIDKTPENIDEISSSQIEVALDYANLWYKDFDHFNVRDIEFYFNLLVDLHTIVQELSTLQQRKIIKASKLLTQGNRDAITYMKIFSENFLKFESDAFQSDLMDCIYVEPTTSFTIKSVIPKMQSAEIAGVSQSVVLPGSMKILLECRLEGRDIVLKGKIHVDLKKFKKILKKIMNSIEQQTSSLKIK